ncbi:DUF1360 domain-containing protein [Streptomyces goshikiensis]|uniref:DUF1360 domain-containing protein n=1 Tax=Streptomyces goshikiensis TaxID=1942 RepID=UPI003647800D
MIDLEQFLLLSLGGYRATQLVVHDSLLDGPRERLDAWQQRRPQSVAREALVTLISCVYCSGWWIAGALLAVWLVVTGQWHQDPLLVHGFEWLAVAGGAVLLNRWDDSRKDS